MLHRIVHVCHVQSTHTHVVKEKDTFLDSYGFWYVTARTCFLKVI